MKQPPTGRLELQREKALKDEYSPQKHVEREEQRSGATSLRAAVGFSVSQPLNRYVQTVTVRLLSDWPEAAL
jgi:hypothetical protein